MNSCRLIGFFIISIHLDKWDYVIDFVKIVSVNTGTWGRGRGFKHTRNVLPTMLAFVISVVAANIEVLMYTKKEQISHFTLFWSFSFSRQLTFLIGQRFVPCKLEVRLTLLVACRCCIINLAFWSHCFSQNDLLEMTVETGMQIPSPLPYKHFPLVHLYD